MNAKNYRRRNKGVLGNNPRSGMGIRLSSASPDNLPYPRVKSAKKFIKMSDSTNCLTMCYEVFLYTGYGCRHVECVHDDPPSILERHGEKLCWKDR